MVVSPQDGRGRDGGGCMRFLFQVTEDSSSRCRDYRSGHGSGGKFHLLTVVGPPGVQFESGLLQIVPVIKAKCPYVKNSNDVGFQLFTRHNPTVFQELVLGDDEKLFASNMNFNDPTVIYFGAFLEQPEDGSGVMVREAYMLRGDTNVIMVDSRHLEAGPWYPTAAENTWYIGNFAAQFIDYLVSRGLKLSKTHLVGHSLGAQSAGVAGSALKSGRVSRITGLDPAFPLFDKLPLEQRLDTSDADFVDVIHTDAGIFGFNRPMGHVDFFPNGGISPQPGCELEVVLTKQYLTNKCEGRTQTQGFYTFYLQANTDKDFKTKLQEFLTYVQTIKLRNSITSKNTDDINKKYSNKVTVNKKLKAKLLGKGKPGDVIKVDLRKTLLSTPTQDTSDNISNINPTIERINHTVQTLTIHTNRTKTHERYINNIRGVEDEETNKNYNDTESALTTLAKSNISETSHFTTVTLQTKNDTPKSSDINDVPSTKNKNTVETIPEALDNKQLKSDITINGNENHKENDRKKRQKRFISLFRKSETSENDNFLFKMLEFLLKNRKNVMPVITVMREINTLVKSGNGELNHVTKERNNYIGSSAVVAPVPTYSLELGNDSKVMAFVKRLLGMTPKGDRLTISGK